MYFNTKEGIMAKLSSYEALYDLMCARFNYAHPHHADDVLAIPQGDLTPFVVLGRIRTDQYGQCMPLSRVVFTDEDRDNMPAVMTVEEYDAYFAEHVWPRNQANPRLPDDTTPVGNYGFHLPPPHIVCSVCGKTWELDDCDDIECVSSMEEYALTEFVGATIDEVNQKLSSQTDAQRTITSPIQLFNSGSSTPDVPPDDLNLYELPRFTASKNTIVTEGDFIVIWVKIFFHGNCFRTLDQEMTAEAEAAGIQNLRNILEETGFEQVCIATAPLPQHMRAWLASQLEEGENADQMADAVYYLRISTSQGTFGIADIVYPLLDLEGTGITVDELEHEREEQIWGSPSITMFTGDPEQLLRLWQLLVKRQASK